MSGKSVVAARLDDDDVESLLNWVSQKVGLKFEVTSESDERESERD